MIGAIAGDMIGSPYEAFPIQHKDFEIRVGPFTDDTVLTVAVAQAIPEKADFADSMACIAGGIAQAFYKTVPEEIVSGVRHGLTGDLLAVVDRFCGMSDASSRTG